MSYRVRQYHSQKSTEEKLLSAIGRGLWWIFSTPFRFLFGKKKSVPRSFSEGGLDQQYVRTKWQEIEQLLTLGKPSNNARTVLEADKLLDHILKGLRAPGLTMGDRLKSAKSRFSAQAYDAAWQAHKVRNEVVHNSQFELMDYHAKEAIENFHKAIKELINF